MRWIGNHERWERLPEAVVRQAQNVNRSVILCDDGRPGGEPIVVDARDFSGRELDRHVFLDVLHLIVHLVERQGEQVRLRVIRFGLNLAVQLVEDDEFSGSGAGRTD